MKFARRGIELAFIIAAGCGDASVDGDSGNGYPNPPPPPFDAGTGGSGGTGSGGSAGSGGSGAQPPVPPKDGGPGADVRDAATEADRVPDTAPPSNDASQDADADTSRPPGSDAGVGRKLRRLARPRAGLRWRHRDAVQLARRDHLLHLRRSLFGQQRAEQLRRARREPFRSRRPHLAGAVPRRRLGRHHRQDQRRLFPVARRQRAHDHEPHDQRGNRRTGHRARHALLLRLPWLLADQRRPHDAVLVLRLRRRFDDPRLHGARQRAQGAVRSHHRACARDELDLHATSQLVLDQRRPTVVHLRNDELRLGSGHGRRAQVLVHQLPSALELRRAGGARIRRAHDARLDQPI